MTKRTYGVVNPAPGHTRYTVGTCHTCECGHTTGTLERMRAHHAISRYLAPDVTKSRPTFGEKRIERGAQLDVYRRAGFKVVIVGEVKHAAAGEMLADLWDVVTDVGPSWAVAA